jgi:HEAT repeat protein
MQRKSLVLLALMALVSAPANGQTTFLNRNLGEWMRELESGKRPSSRRSAAFALGRMGPVASYAIPDLAKRISSDSDAGVRDMSAVALGDIVLSLRGFTPIEQWKAAGKALEDALADDKDSRVRRSAAYAIGAFGTVASPAASTVRKALTDKHPSVRQNAAWALGRLGATDVSTVADLCDRLGDTNALVRRDAAAALKTLGESGASPALFKASARPLLDLVKNERDEVVRKTALGALASLAGPEHAGLAGDIYPLLESKDPDTVRSAAFVLGNMGGEPARRALPELQKALRDSDPINQELAAATLSRAGKAAIPAVEELARVLTLSEDPKVRANCAVALAHIGIASPAETKSAVPALAEALKPVAKASAELDRKYLYDRVRILAAEALSRIDFPHNEAAIPAIREAIRKDPHRDVRHRCVWATFNMRLEDFERFELVKVLSGVLEETSRDTQLLRYDSARKLAHLLESRAPDKVCDVLLEMIENSDLKVFKGSDAAIKGTPDESKGGASKVSEKAEGDGRYMAAQAMGWLKDKAKNNKAIVAALQKAAKDDEPKLKEAARKALADLGLKPE